MKRMVTTGFVVAGLLAASSALALNIKSHQNLPQVVRPSASAVALGCDNDNPTSALYQGTDDRIGNLFNFGAGANLSSVSFFHFGFGFAGPYNYNIEIWDPASCTLVAAKNGLVAQDASASIPGEIVDMCPSQLYLTGSKLVTIDPNTCLAPDDCYPDLLFDSQLNVSCPYVISTASTAPVCNDVKASTGPFLLRVETNGCATPTQRSSWGQMKSIYR